jgi:hypothetical protein
MSRLRRLVASDRWFFITRRLLAERRTLSDSEFAALGWVNQERLPPRNPLHFLLDSRTEIC